MKDIYEYFKAPIASVAPGELIQIAGDEFLTVLWDEATTAKMYDRQQGLIWVRVSSQCDRLVVSAPSLDDAGLSAWFVPTADMHLSKLTEVIHEWAAKRRYRDINLTALGEYCVWLGAESVERL